jgi:hypothetical protein
MFDTTYQSAVENAAHYKAIGKTDIYLFAGPFPWEHVTKVEPGGSHRIDMATDARFHADDPCGLSFRWTFDIEPRSASGKGHYEIDVGGCHAVLAKLPEAARRAFRDYLSQCADKVAARAEEYQALADKQRSAARALIEAAA